MPHATATFNGKVIAEADKWESVEGNVYVRTLESQHEHQPLTGVVPT